MSRWPKSYFTQTSESHTKDPSDEEILHVPEVY